MRSPRDRLFGVLFDTLLVVLRWLVFACGLSHGAAAADAPSLTVTLVPLVLTDWEKSPVRNPASI